MEQIGTPPDEFTEELIRPLVEKQALVQAINDAWLLIGVLTALAVLLVFFVRKIPTAKEVEAIGKVPEKSVRLQGAHRRAK